jgi:hypothetical protein
MRCVNPLLTRLPRAAAALALALGLGAGLSACGGGVYYYDDGGDWQPPDVSIAAPAQAQAGSTVRLTAAAVDDWSGVEQVGFYRVEGNSAVLLGTDRSRPYEWLMTVPNDGRNYVEVFAWARDREGNEADSAVVRIAILP